MIQKRNRFSTNSQKSKKIALDFQPLANPKIENMKRRFIFRNLLLVILLVCFLQTLSCSNRVEREVPILYKDSR